MSTKIIRKIISICNLTNNTFPGKKSYSGLATGYFENAKLFEGLVTLNKKNQDKSNRKKKSASHHRIFFSQPLPRVLMLMTDSLQGK